jgi:hypothetical protein
VKLVSIGGVALSDYHLAGTASGIVRGLPGPDRSPNTLERTGAPALIAGMRRGARPIPLVLYLDPTYTGSNAQAERTRELWLRKFLGKLDIESDDPRLIVCQIDTDGDNTLDLTVECEGVAGGWQWIEEVKGIAITFYGTSAHWFAQSLSYQPGPAATNVYTANSSPESLTVANDGETTARPLVGICMASGGQRATQTADVGWKYRQRFSVTNNTDEDWENELGTLELGDTAALVTATKAQSDGDDLRVRVEGRELPRTLTNWNTLLTFVHIPLTIPAGESVEYEVVYGNPSAESPADADDLTERDDGFSTLSNYAIVNGKYSAIDLTGDSGTATSGGATTLTQTGKTWPTNYWTGGYLALVSGTGGSAATTTHARRRIDSNTATQITVERAWTTDPASGTGYVLWKSGPVQLGGRVTTGGAATSLTDNLQAFGTNELVGYTIYNFTQSLGPVAITANTATTITHAAIGGNWAVGDSYRINGVGAHAYHMDRDAATINGVEINHRGLFQINRHYSKPTDLDLDGSQSIGGWGRTTLIDNNDDYSQASFLFNSGPNTYWPVLYARRRKSSSRTYAEEQQGDGLSITDPRRFKGIRFDYEMLNGNSTAGASVGVGKFVAGGRDTGSQEWEWFEEDDTRRTLSAFVAVAYYDLTNTKPSQIALGVLPQDETAVVSSASASDEINVKGADRMELYIDPSSITYGASSGEEAVYDLAGSLTSDIDGSDLVGDVLTFGGPGHYVHLTATQVLWVDCESGEVYVTTGGPISGGGPFTFSHYAPWAMRPLVYEDDTDGDGVLEPKVSANWMPMNPGSQTWRWVEDAIGVLEIRLSFYKRYLG